MVRNRGISLMELLIVVALVGGVSVMVMRSFSGTTNAAAKVSQQMGTRTGLMGLAGTIQKFLPSGDLKFFLWGDGAPEARTVARAVIPLVDRCADLSTCPGSSALVYTHYDRSIVPALSAICFEPGASYDGNFIVDLNRIDYGAAVAAGDGFDVTGSMAAPGGHFTVEPNRIIALLNMPQVTLWRVVGAATAMNLGPSAPGSLPAACQPNLQGGDTSRLYRVPVAALQLPAFVRGNPALTFAQTGPLMGTFPMRLTPAELRSFGLRATDPNPEFQERCRRTGDAPGCPAASLLRCRLAGETLECPADATVAEVPNVRGMRVEATFKLPLAGSTMPTYDLMTPGGVQNPACGPAAQCGALPVALPLPIFESGETRATLGGGALSAYKLEFLARLRVRASVEISGQAREETFDVVVP